MLFNSFAFLFLFLPITAAVFFVLAKKSQGLAAGWLAAASLFFYGWWSLLYLPLLICSIVFNYWSGLRIAHATGSARRYWLIFAIIIDLGLLAYFKYADFFISTINAIAQSDVDALNIILPIGISFFTFTQIAFLVDTYQEKVREYRFLHYLLFVTYFPHLIAGPVLHHKEMMPQFAEAATYRLSLKNLAIGLSIFAIGLAKKVLIADNLAGHANFMFDQTEDPSLFIAWGGVLAYSFQLYFDFSGYSDMAIGLSRIFGIKLPLNFNSPYKAANVIEFWRRWHMTLSRFLRDYLYIALGGNRKGMVRRYSNLMATMVLGGLWHGASWNFVLWGALHGAYLIWNHAWIALAKRVGFPTSTKLWHALSVVLTFISICFAWVFFRATDMATALIILKGMIGGFGSSLPDSIGNQLGPLKQQLEDWGISFYLGGGARFVQTYAWVLLAGAIAFSLPNTQQLMGRFEPALDYRFNGSTAFTGSHKFALVWQPNARWAAWIGILAVISLLSINRPTEFLYFQF
ncbi:MAG TPA: MBOAT family protein [Noviherbaspirillum sp.]|nr:MBOAT family protein [Noviherbaspirillum sp.]